MRQPVCIMSLSPVNLLIVPKSSRCRCDRGVTHCTWRRGVVLTGLSGVGEPRSMGEGCPKYPHNSPAGGGRPGTKPGHNLPVSRHFPGRARGTEEALEKGLPWKHPGWSSEGGPLWDTAVPPTGPTSRALCPVGVTALRQDPPLLSARLSGQPFTKFLPPSPGVTVCPASSKVQFLPGHFSS